MTKNIRRDDWEKLEPTVYGWGINDVDYIAYNSNQITPYYQDWKAMLRRCFDNKYQTRQPSYTRTTVCNDWKYFSNFIIWVDSQENTDWFLCELDKDILGNGAKHYSPSTCAYISGYTNRFIKNDYLIKPNHNYGVYVTKDSRKNPYRSQVKNPFTGKTEKLGYFPTELEAHLAWKKRKHEIACLLSDLEADQRIKSALCNLFA